MMQFELWIVVVTADVRVIVIDAVDTNVVICSIIGCAVTTVVVGIVTVVFVITDVLVFGFWLVFCYN